MDINKLNAEYFSIYGKEPDHIFFSPGRVNLIGEHIDYNGGQVMPCAVSLGTYLAISKNTDKHFRFNCINFSETATVHLQQSYSKTSSAWYNYPLGVIDQLLATGNLLSGADMLFYGNLPIAAGLSSSASIEVLTAFAFTQLFELKISLKEIALLAKKTENSFIGVSCGIMDQFAVTFGKKKCAILLNCDTLDYKYLPFETGEYRLVIINTNKQRTLADSKYNERFMQCGIALKALKKKLSLDYLCELTVADFEKYSYLVDDPVIKKRAMHVITENQRVHDAEKALEQHQISTFGKLMYASHESLRNDYGVSGMELDAIVDFSKNFDGCIGARMTGAGFGGCAIALVKNEAIAEYSQQLTASYTAKTGYAPGIFESEIGDGVREFD